MAHTEAEIRRAIKPLLTAYGELDTTEVKRLLHTVMEFDAEDMEDSPTRNEMKIIQRIGNIAHIKKRWSKYMRKRDLFLTKPVLLQNLYFAILFPNSPCRRKRLKK